MAKKSTATEQLAELREAEERERSSIRDLDTALAAAEDGRLKARQRLVEAHVSETDRTIKAAQAAFDKATAAVEDIGLRREGRQLRIRGAQQEREAFEAEHADRLVAELEPEAHAVRDRLAAAAAEVIAADKAWRATYAKVNQALAANPASDPRHDMAADHAFTPFVNDLARALRNGATVAPPLPHNRHRRLDEESQLRTRLVKLTRQRKPSAEDQAEIARLKSRIGMSR